MRKRAWLTMSLRRWARGERVPADPGVAVFEMESRRAPQEQADPLAVLFSDLVKAVAGGEAGTQKVFSLQQGRQSAGVR